MTNPDEPRPESELPEPSPSRLPRWRGFNLTEMFTAGSARAFLESDFAAIRRLGFNFVRLPMDYRCWTDPAEPYAPRAEPLTWIDRAVELGRACGVHVCLNLHRAPGYCVNQGESDGLDLWTEDEAQKQFAFQWSTFARRYRGVSNAQVSFNLVNEPARIGAEAYVPVVRRAVEAIRREDPDRLILADGLDWGNVPVFELADLGIAQSTRGYTPHRVSHYRANWIDSAGWPPPTWPLAAEGEVFDADRLRADRIAPWQALEAAGVGVHVGEFGCYHHTPHDVALAYLGDSLALWREAGWGWALWNFRGAFGVLDSARDDVDYEPFEDRLLDRKMLSLLQAS